MGTLLARSLSPALVLLTLATAPAAADPFWYAQAPRESIPLPARYTDPLPAWIDPDPSAGTWRRRLDRLPSGPTHLAWRLCHGDARVEAQTLEAIRHAVEASPDARIDHRFAIELGTMCGSGTRADESARCEWMRRVARSEPAGRVREFFFEQVLACAEPGDRALFEDAGTPDSAVVAFHWRVGPLGYSDRLAAALRRGVERSDPNVDGAVEVISRVDDPRVTRLLLDLRDETDDPEAQHLLALGLVHQSDPGAFDVYRHAWRRECEMRRAAAGGNPRAGMLRDMLRDALDPDCDGAPPERPLPPPLPPADGPDRIDEPAFHAALRASLVPFGLDDAFLVYDSIGAEAIGDHAPLMRRLAHRVAPDLDDVVLEEVWPALDGFDFERGPERAYAVVDRLGFEMGVRDAGDLARATEELDAALAQPHWVDAYVDGARFRFALRPLGRRFDAEGIVGALNQLLEVRHSEKRLLLLQPVDGRSIVFLAGPRDRLLAAIRAGAARPATGPSAAAGG